MTSHATLTRDARGAAPEPPSVDASPLDPRRTRLLVLAATAVSALLGLFQLGHDSFWVDDGFSVTHASLGNGDFWHVIGAHEMNAAAYSTLLHLWVQVGSSETWVRLPSVLFATAAVPLLFLLGRRLFGERVGLVACWLLAVNAYVVEYAHEARTYAFTLFLAIASVSLFVRFVRDPSRGVWVAWVLCTGLLGNAHFFGTLIAASEGVAMAARGPLPTPRRGLVKGFAAIALLYLPIVWFLGSGGDQGQVAHVAATTPYRFVGVFDRLVGNGGPLLLLLVGIAIALALVHEAWPIVASRRVRDERDWATVLVVTWVAVPILSILVLSVVKPLFGARYFLLVTPALTLLAALGVVGLARRRVAQVLLGAILATSVVATMLWYPRSAPDDFRAATAEVLRSAQPGDGIVFVPWFARTTFELYADRTPNLEARLDPLEPAPDWGDWLLIDQPPALNAARADDLLSGHDRVWLVERGGADEPDQGEALTTVRAALDRRGYETEAQRTYPGLTVTLYQRP